MTDVKGMYAGTMDGCHLQIDIARGSDAHVLRDFSIHASAADPDRVMFKRSSNHVYEWRLDVNSLGSGRITLKPGTGLSLNVGIDDRDSDGSYGFTRWESEAFLISAGGALDSFALTCNRKWRKKRVGAGRFACAPKRRIPGSR